MAGDTWVSSAVFSSSRASFGIDVPTKIFHPTKPARFEGENIVAVGCSGVWLLGRSAIKRLIRSDWTGKELQTHQAALFKRFEGFQSRRLKRSLTADEQAEISCSLLILTSSRCFKVVASLYGFQMTDVTKKRVAIGSGARAAERSMMLGFGVIVSVLFAYHYVPDSWGPITLVSQTGNTTPRSVTKWERLCWTAVAEIMKKCRVF